MSPMTLCVKLPFAFRRLSLFICINQFQYLKSLWYGLLFVISKVKGIKTCAFFIINEKIFPTLSQSETMYNITFM